MKSSTLSVVLATKNEEENIGRVLKSVQKIADEIIIADEYSTDDTRKIAKKYGSKVYKVKHSPIFHVTKQFAMNKAKSDWILQLDADEVVSKNLAKEIRTVINLSTTDIEKRRPKSKKKWRLFQRHQKAVEKRDGKLGEETGEVVAFFIPRINYFVGKPLRYAGVYPDAVIRLIKNGKARLPGKSVHEQMIINGQVAWLFNDLEHHDSPTLKRYIKRLNRYTSLKADEHKANNVPKNLLSLFWFISLKPALVFAKLFFRHRGYKDGLRGFLWSALSAAHYPISYFKYWTS